MIRRMVRGQPVYEQVPEDAEVEGDFDEIEGEDEYEGEEGEEYEGEEYEGEEYEGDEYYE